MLVPPFHPAPDWAQSLAENLLHPQHPISFWEALGRHLRRNYIWLYFILGLAWLSKVWLHPIPACVRCGRNLQIWAGSGGQGQVDLWYTGIISRISRMACRQNRSDGIAHLIVP